MTSYFVGNNERSAQNVILSITILKALIIHISPEFKTNLWNCKKHYKNLKLQVITLIFNRNA